jgi:Zn-finger nucleic acid-binding protein
VAKTDGLASVGSKALPCPVCKIPLYPAGLDGQDVLHCAECEGLGISREAMMKLQPLGEKKVQTGAEERNHKTPAFFEPRQKPPFLICPFCGKKMGALKLGNTELDQCEKCGGLWLEGPKLEWLKDLIGPYKSRISKAKGDSRRR